MDREGGKRKPKSFVRKRSNGDCRRRTALAVVNADRRQRSATGRSPAFQSPRPLPGLDGYELASGIRAAPEQEVRKARLIALTGHVRDNDMALAREAGFDANMVKPYEINELERLIEARPRPA